ncbi:MAG: zinc-ribbon domain containing protein [Chloracidobacterium sp.]|nr:zinc-ribbon domain containing protein [Chloracidobacterium sp.]MCC6826432.1 zinc-ribbon domain containing protein [Acidobacteriota bacterium]
MSNDRLDNETIVPEHLQDQHITCADCYEEFTWSAGEQRFFLKKGLTDPPKRCRRCKQAKTDRIASLHASRQTGVRSRIDVIVKCARCDAMTTVPFFPSQGRPVFCRSCYIFVSGEPNKPDKDDQPPT